MPVQGERASHRPSSGATTTHGRSGDPAGPGALRPRRGEGLELGPGHRAGHRRVGTDGGLLGERDRVVGAGAVDQRRGEHQQPPDLTPPGEGAEEGADRDQVGLDAAGAVELRAAQRWEQHHVGRSRQQRFQGGVVGWEAAGDEAPVGVEVGGRAVVADGHHPLDEGIGEGEAHAAAPQRAPCARDHDDRSHRPIMPATGPGPSRMRPGNHRVPWER